MAHNLQPCLIFCTASHGGLADYAHAQAEALADLGQTVLLLAPPQFPFQSARYQRLNLPTIGLAAGRFRWLQRLGTAATILAQQLALNRAIASTGCRRVLFTTYSEYLAPLWAWRLRLWQRRGVRFAAVVHDPVRNYVVGPRWWHRLSIAQGYSFLAVALVHAPIDLNIGSRQPRLRTTVIPHGPYQYPAPQATAQQLRTSLGVPDDATLLLSFGHIRDNKNLQLVLKAMVQWPQLWLLVAGPEATAGQLPSSHYRDLAHRLGVAERCFWHLGYQSPDQVANHFTAADVLLLTYSSSFRSESGVLHLGAHYRKPVIASAGDSALLNVVKKFAIGEVIEADNPVALEQGLRHLLMSPPTPDWNAYERSNSWHRNAQLVIEAMDCES